MMRLLFWLFFVPSLVSALVVALIVHVAENGHPILVAAAGFASTLFAISLIAPMLPLLVEEAAKCQPRGG